MLIRVQYNNDGYDYLLGGILNQQLAQKKIKRFYRPSEKRWVTVGVDHIRGMGVSEYDGPERRGMHPAYAIMGAS
ncbi:MAG: hypothetical protein JW743_12055 [Deltaproteobacteria bacterium]|nr:hypothetical protein [Deltaproteobacteria bacterium]MBN2845161.1 hypothetical protein [Deltaproteobacteria bacterium]